MLRYALPLILLALFTSTALANTDEKLVLPVSLAGITSDGPRGKPTEPQIAKSLEELTKLLGESNADKLKNRIDFATHELVLFQWAGSGQDKINATVKDDTVNFQYQPGRTRDLRRHRTAFAVKKGTEWKVTSKFRMPGKKL